MKSSLVLSSLSLLALHPRDARAFWRMACGVSQTSRTDPILSPGTVSGHVHKFAGGNNVNPSSTQDSLLTSTCSSCEVQEDKSAYWTPQLYYSHSNGTVEEVRNEGMTVYYVGRGGDSSNTVPFPPGFQMISGNSLLRSYDATDLTYQDTRPIADRVSFRCINEANNIPEQHYMFDTDCVNGMRAQINFQSCWDGQNLYLPNSEHVAYLNGIDYGSCPPTHPIPIPGLFYEVLYWTNRVDQSAGGQFVFANGDATGYGFHGDFLNGWNQDVQTAAVQECLYTDNDGVVPACAALAPSYDVNVKTTCPESPSFWNEPVHGFLDSIPGCNPITYGPGIAPQVICPLNSDNPTQSAASSVPLPTDFTISSTTSGEFASTTTTSFTPFPTDGFNTTTSSAAGFFPANSTTTTTFATFDTSTPTSSSTILTATLPSTPSQTPILSFTTVFVTATAPLDTATSTSFLASSDACSFYNGFEIVGCTSTSTAVTDTASTFTSTPTPTGFRSRLRRDVSEDLARLIAEISTVKDDESKDGTNNKGTTTEAEEGANVDTSYPTISAVPTSSSTGGDGADVVVGSGMGCFLWGSCS